MGRVSTGIDAAAGDWYASVGGVCIAMVAAGVPIAGNGMQYTMSCAMASCCRTIMECAAASSSSWDGAEDANLLPGAAGAGGNGRESARAGILELLGQESDDMRDAASAEAARRRRSHCPGHDFLAWRFSACSRINLMELKTDVDFED